MFYSAKCNNHTPKDKKKELRKKKKDKAENHKSGKQFRNKLL
jgi:hypothetical protein